MWKWLNRIGLIALLAFGGYVAYDSYMAGYLTRPKMPEGAFSLSYKSGLRGILVNVPEERETRRYIGFPAEVPFYLKDAWSWCYPPTKEDSAPAAQFMAARDWPGQRLDAVCKITVEGKEIVRGVIVSVPRV